MPEQLLKCSECGKIFRAPNYDDQRTYSCKRCGGKLDAVSKAPTPSPEQRPAEKPDPLVGSQIGPYRILAKLGEGGMGAVYKAQHVDLRRLSALKLLPQHKAERSRRAVQRFLREARSAAALSHPNIVSVFYVGQADGWHFIDMEFVEGESLHDRLERVGKLSVQDATAVTIDIAHALAAAHAKGIVHRDVKPANVLLAKDGAVKVADFGLAKNVEGENTLVTIEGQGGLGTPSFMSPEQYDGMPLDGRSDIYSLGVTYYYLLTGDLPFKPDASGSVAYKHRSTPAPDPRTHVADLPETAVEVIERAMAKRPEDRYQTCDEMAAALADVAAGKPAERSAVGLTKQGIWARLRQWPKPAAIAAGAALVCAIGLLLFIALRSPARQGHAAPPAEGRANEATGPAAPRIVPPKAQMAAAKFKVLEALDADTQVPEAKKVEFWQGYLRDFRNEGYQVAYAESRLAHWTKRLAEIERQREAAARQQRVDRAKASFEQLKRADAAPYGDRAKKVELWQAYLREFRDAGYQVSFAQQRLAYWKAGLAKPEPGEVRINPKDRAEMVWIPAGSFLMGADKSDIERIFDKFGGKRDWIEKYANGEAPKHRVKLDGFLDVQVRGDRGAVPEVRGCDRAQDHRGERGHGPTVQRGREEV